MLDIHTLLLFSGAVLALLVSPGPNMALLLSHSISHGLRGGLAIALGIFAADIVLTALTAAGITAVIAAWPPSFDVLRFLGALYLVWLALQALRTRSTAIIERKQQSATLKVFQVGMLNSLLNPKALLFFMVFLPQFVNADRGNVSSQLLVLGLVLSVWALIFHAMLAAFSGKARTLFMRGTASSRYFGWVHAGVLLALAARLALLEQPTSR